MNFKPLGSRVAIKVNEAKKKTASGIIIPEASKETPLIGKIVAINGEVKEDYNLDLNTEVIFPKFSGTEITIEKERVLIIDVEELLGVLG